MRFRRRNMTEVVTVSISDVSIKKLWARSAGFCAYPGCEENCVSFIAGNVEIIVGEMAHVIASSPSGPRGRPTGGSDDYDNLVLLCPTHHRAVDKAPAGTFPEEMLQNWKATLEKRVRESLEAPLFASRSDLNAAIRKRLIESRVCWNTFGPESSIATKNKNSDAGEIWSFRKLTLIIPNNRYIINSVQNNSGLFTPEEYELCCHFFEHADAFERASIEPKEDVPRFPIGLDRIFYEQR